MQVTFLLISLFQSHKAIRCFSFNWHLTKCFFSEDAGDEDLCIIKTNVNHSPKDTPGNTGTKSQQKTLFSLESLILRLSSANYSDQMDLLKSLLYYIISNIYLNLYFY